MSCRPVRLFYQKVFSGLVLLVLLLAAAGARAGDPDDDYLKVYGQLQEADALESSGKTSQAMAKYQQALGQLKAFQRNYPDWNVKVVNTRVNWVSAHIVALSEQPAAPARSTAPVASGPAQGRAVAPGEPKLVEAGAEPRQVLRLHPKPGDQQTVDLILKISTTSKVGQMEGPAIKLPALKLTLAVTVKSVSPEGDISYEMVMSDASVADEPGALPQMVEMMKAAFSQAKGMSGSGTVSDRGIGKGVDVKMPGNGDPASRQVLDQLKEVFSGAIVPLPEEAVGPGAKWEVRTAVRTQGIQVEQTEVYEVVSVEGDHLKAKATGTERVGSRLAGKDTGELTYELGHLLPTEASAQQHRESSMTVDNGGHKQAVTQKMDVSVRVQARAVATPAGTGAPQKQ